MADSGTPGNKDQLKSDLCVYGLLRNLPFPRYSASRFFYQFWERSGAIVLKDKRVYSFDLWSPKALYLETEDGASCVLELPIHNVGSVAAWGHATYKSL
jgi:hypothetical protein